MRATDPDLARELTAHREWWRLAGVDLDFADDATAWLGEPESAESVQTPEPSPRKEHAALAEDPIAEKTCRPNLLGDAAPETLDAFQEWWLSAPGLDPIGPRGRVCSRGPAEASVMVLVVHPEEGDSDRLLAGPQGKLLEAILAAMGTTSQETYVASALPRYMPMADCTAEMQRGMGEVLAHHIALAAPRRIVAFGAGLAALLGNDAEKDYGNLPIIHHKPSNIPVMMSEDLESLMGMPKLKARFWRRWLEWSA